MKRLHIFFLLPSLIFLFSCGQNAMQPQAGNNIQLLRYFGGPGGDEAADLKVLDNGDLLISGSLAPESLSDAYATENGGGEFYGEKPSLPTVLQVSPQGDLVWQAILKLPNRLKNLSCVYPQLKAVASDATANGEIWTLVNAKTEEQFGGRGERKDRIFLYKLSNGAEVIEPVFLHYDFDAGFSNQENCTSDNLLEAKGIIATADGGALVCADFLNENGDNLVYQLLVLKVSGNGEIEGDPFIVSDQGALESFGVEMARLVNGQIALLSKEGQWTGDFESLDSQSRIWLFDENGRVLDSELFPAGRVSDIGFADMRQSMYVHDQGISLMEVVYHPDANSDSIRIWELTNNLDVQSRTGFPVPRSFFMDYIPLPIQFVKVAENDYACTFSNPDEGLIRAWRFDGGGAQLDTMNLGIPGPNQAASLTLKPGTQDFYLLNTMVVATETMITLMEIQDWRE